MKTFPGITEVEIRRKLRITKMSKPCKYTKKSKTDKYYKTNLYPKKDKYISNAIAFADKKYPDKSIPSYARLWNQAYGGEMDRILSEKKLRLL